MKKALLVGLSAVASGAKVSELQLRSAGGRTTSITYDGRCW